MSSISGLSSPYSLPLDAHQTFLKEGTLAKVIENSSKKNESFILRVYIAGVTKIVHRITDSIHAIAAVLERTMSANSDSDSESYSDVFDVDAIISSIRAKRLYRSDVECEMQKALARLKLLDSCAFPQESTIAFEGQPDSVSEEKNSSSCDAVVQVNDDEPANAAQDQDTRGVEAEPLDNYHCVVQ